MTTYPPPFDQRMQADLSQLFQDVKILKQQIVQATSSGGGLPSGPAGGDLAGTYPNPALARPLAIIPTFSYTGVIAVYTGDSRWYNDTGRTLTFGTIRASLGVAPTGSSAIFDVLANGSTIFTTPAHRPTVAASTNTAVNSAPPDVLTLASGSYLTVSIAQIGSATAGSDLTVTVVMT